MITFTGSPDVGWGIKARAPRKKVGLELGNNAPLIIEPSADVETAAKKVVGRRLQPRRAVVHLDATAARARATCSDAFLDALVPLVEGLVVGDPMDEQTDVSALISDKERDRVTSWVDEAVAAGAEVLAGGKVREDGVLMPTVLGNVTPDMKVCAHEVFGPVVARRRPTTTSTTRSGSRTTRATGSRPRSSPPTSTTPCAPLARSTSAACS